MPVQTGREDQSRYASSVANRGIMVTRRYGGGKVPTEPSEKVFAVPNTQAFGPQPAQKILTEAAQGTRTYASPKGGRTTEEITSPEFYATLGHPEFGGKYETFYIPPDMRVTKITENSQGLLVEVASKPTVEESAAVKLAGL